jgi:hypothetical protein
MGDEGVAGDGRLGGQPVGVHGDGARDGGAAEDQEHVGAGVGGGFREDDGRVAGSRLCSAGGGCFGGRPRRRPSSPRGSPNSGIARWSGLR